MFEDESIDTDYYEGDEGNIMMHREEFLAKEGKTQVIKEVGFQASPELRIEAVRFAAGLLPPTAQQLINEANIIVNYLLTGDTVKVPPVPGTLPGPGQTR